MTSEWSLKNEGGKYTLKYGNYDGDIGTSIGSFTTYLNSLGINVETDYRALHRWYNRDGSNYHAVCINCQKAPGGAFLNEGTTDNYEDFYIYDYSGNIVYTIPANKSCIIIWPYAVGDTGESKDLNVQECWELWSTSADDPLIIDQSQTINGDYIVEPPPVVETLKLSIEGEITYDTNTISLDSSKILKSAYPDEVTVNITKITFKASNVDLLDSSKKASLYWGKGIMLNVGEGNLIKDNITLTGATQTLDVDIPVTIKDGEDIRVAIRALDHNGSYKDEAYMICKRIDSWGDEFDNYIRNVKIVVNNTEITAAQTIYGNCTIHSAYFDSNNVKDIQFFVYKGEPDTSKSLIQDNIIFTKDVTSLPTPTSYTPINFILNDIGDYSLFLRGVGVGYIYSPIIRIKTTEKTNSVTIIDTGTTGTSISPTEILYSGNSFIASTMTHKDNTLFLGNIKNDANYIDKTLRESVRELKGSFKPYTVNEDDVNSLDVEYVFNSVLLKSNKETYFKKGEYYRFGLQFQYITGQWSEVLYVEDLLNDVPMIPLKYNDGIQSKPLYSLDFPKDLAQKFISKGYIAVRPVCVYPDFNSRKVLCQGIICPTLYNVKDRYNNAPYAQSDWFARPQYTFIPDNTLSEEGTPSHKGYYLWSDMLSNKVNHHNYYDASSPNDGNDESSENYSLRRMLPRKLLTVRTTNTWRASALPSALSFNGEIQCASLSDQFTDKYTQRDSIDTIFGIDKRILTLHSPELDDHYSDDFHFLSSNNNVKLRVVGYAPIKHTLSDLSIQATNPTSYAKEYNGAISNNAQSTNQVVSSRSLINWQFWIDRLYYTKKDYNVAQAYVVYPWNRKGPLNNQGRSNKDEDSSTSTDNTNRKSILEKKIYSNYRICLPSRFLEDTEIKEYSLDDFQLFSSDQMSTIINLKAWGKTIQYKGNYEKIITCNYTDTPELFASLQYTGITCPSNVLPPEAVEGIPKDPYPLNGDIDTAWVQSHKNLKSDFLGNWSNGDNEAYRLIAWNNRWSNIGNFAWRATSEATCLNNDPIPIQYRSTGHIVMSLSKNEDSYNILPKLYNISDITKENVTIDKNSSFVFNDSDDAIGVYKFNQDYIDITDTSIIEDDYNNSNHKRGDFGYYLIGELYRDEILNPFGGTDENALSNNTWSICGDTTSLYSDKITILADQGDTFYCRYDHLKTYNSTNEDINQIVDIPSFMVETRINIDGRYDRNRGNKNNLAISPTNFNLFNKVYSQSNNFFPANYLEENKTTNVSFPNQVVWSLTKTLGEEIDSWTNINLTNALDLDGDLGSVNALKRINNNIYAFQDKGISAINFNSRVQINTSDNVPIEIANSGKVDGKVYITNQYGCQNKWSIADTTSGIYFTDNINKCIFAFDGKQLNDITYTKGMYSWILSNSSLNIWNPKYHNSIRTLYDKVNKDVYFTTNQEALSFNEKLGDFSSFYDYNNVDWIFNINESTYQIKGDTIWKLHGNEEYGNYFNIPYNYSVSFISNQEFQMDKVYSDIEFRTNDLSTYDNLGRKNIRPYDSSKETKEEYEKYIESTYPFYQLTTENEYQKAISNYTKLAKKFRIFRWDVDRNTLNGFTRDRIRNPWAKFTLEGNSKTEVRLYDLVVDYYV